MKKAVKAVEKPQQIKKPKTAMKDDSSSSSESSSSSSESSSSDSDSTQEVPANKAEKKEAKALGKQIVGKPLAKEIKKA